MPKKTQDERKCYPAELEVSVFKADDTGPLAIVSLDEGEVWLKFSDHDDGQELWIAPGDAVALAESILFCARRLK